MEKFRESRLQLYGHVICDNEILLAKTGLNIEVQEKQPKDRPKQWLVDTLDGDLKASLVSRLGKDRIKLRTRLRRAVPACERDRG